MGKKGKVNTFVYKYRYMKSEMGGKKEKYTYMSVCVYMFMFE